MTDLENKMHEIANNAETCDEAKAVANALAKFEQGRPALPCQFQEPVAEALPIDREFHSLYADAWADGARIAGQSKVVVVGMARDVGDVLPLTFRCIEKLVRQFRDWGCVIVENDSKDETKELLRVFQQQNAGHVEIELQDFGRERLQGFEPARVERYATYRNRYSDIARETFGDADYVLAIDTDPHGGFSTHGVINGIGWLNAFPKAAGMASLSIYEYPVLAGRPPMWCHYDQWAFRWQGWETRLEPWFNLWLPPPGSPPIRVLSAFGAGCVYKAKPFFDHRYASIAGDIEHVGLHKAMHAAGWDLYLNPAQRCLMHWMPKESDGGQHSDH